MADILIHGGDAEAAAQAIRAAVREIFETDPIQSSAGTTRPGTRGLLEATTLIMTIPPAVVYSKKMLEDFHLVERWRRLITRAKNEQKVTGARIMIDPGDGNHIPIEDAHPEKVREALIALQEKRSKS